MADDREQAGGTVPCTRAQNFPSFGVLWFLYSST